MKTKTINKNTSKWNVLRKLTPRGKMFKDVLKLNQLNIITAQF